MKTFLVVWFGQFISVIGSSLTSFALGIWVLKETGSISKFSIILLCASLPNILLSMFAGVIVDRFKRKWIMMISDGVAGLASLVLFTLLYTKSLEIWHIYLIVGITSIFSSLQMPAYQSSVSLLVPKEQLGRANGFMQLADASSIVIAPILAGFLLHLFGLYSVVLIDFLSFLVAISTMLMVKLPELGLSNKEKLNTASFLREAKSGWIYIKERKGLKWLLINFAIANFLLGFFNVLLQPLILALSNERVLGVVISMTGIGMLAGSILMSSWGGPKRKVKGLFGFGTMIGVCIGIAGTSESLVLITVALTLSLFCLPISNACSRVIWQSKVDPKIQGRVFSLRSMVSTSLSPIAIVLAGPVAENIFQPLMEKDGALGETIGAVIGAGAGRGIGLLFICIGFIYLVSSVMIYLHPRVRQLEQELPDAIEEVKVQEVTVGEGRQVQL